MSEVMVVEDSSTSSDSSDSEVIFIQEETLDAANDLEQLISMSLITKDDEDCSAASIEGVPSPNKNPGFAFKIQEVKSLAPEANNELKIKSKQQPVNTKPQFVKIVPKTNKPIAATNVKRTIFLKDHKLIDPHPSTSADFDPNKPIATSKRMVNENAMAKQLVEPQPGTSTGGITVPSLSIRKLGAKRRKSDMVERVVNEYDESVVDHEATRDITVPPPPKEPNADINALRTVAFLRVSVNHILEKLGRRPIAFDRARPTLANLVYKYSKC